MFCYHGAAEKLTEEECVFENLTRKSNKMSVLRKIDDERCDQMNVQC